MSELTHAYWHDRSFSAMGTTARLVVGDASSELVDWAEAEVARLEQSWSRFLPNSDLRRLNEHCGEWVEVTPLLALALERATELWQVTAGAFDPTIIDALERAGYDRSFEFVPRDAATPAPAPRPAPGFGAIAFDPVDRCVCLPAGTRLDLGGVGKGLAADMVAEGLVDRGARSALVSIGGDMRSCGDPPSAGWQIPVVASPTTTVMFEHPLIEGAIVQSTCAIRSWVRGGRVLHHIIDPGTGAPAATGVATVVVAGPEAWLSEGLAKAAIVLGDDRGAALLRDAGVDAWIIEDSGRCHRIEGTVQCSSQ